jgi:hypothetical protein
MRVFWQPRRGGQLSGLWARCENCGWSGPYEFFDLWQAELGNLYICSSPACQTEWVRRALAASGFVRCAWERSDDPGRGAYE